MAAGKSVFQIEREMEAAVRRARTQWQVAPSYPVKLIPFTCAAGMRNLALSIEQLSGQSLREWK